MLELEAATSEIIWFNNFIVYVYKISKRTTTVLVTEANEILSFLNSHSEFMASFFLRLWFLYTLFHKITLLLDIKRTKNFLYP